jgi:UDP-N-acetylmuramyl pentapeptide phosphotransferase/UDP-N-acetylglucosamine-1-phosphate transferase
MILLFFFQTLFATLLINFIFKKKKFAYDSKSYSFHKKLTSNNTQVPLSGGLIFLFILIFSDYLFSEYFFFIFFIFLIGFLSDLNILTSAKIKILIQIFIIFLYIFFSSNYINSIRINFYDTTNNFFILKIIFTLFCLLILINGSNFIDGINSLSLGYFLIVVLNIIFLSNKTAIQADNIQLIFVGLLILYLFNFFEKLYLGDGGIYSLSFFIGIYLITISNNNNIISPYYFALLLWYPAFENLFSILRRFFYNESYFKPDNRHLHQILFLSLKKKFRYKLSILNSATGIIICIYNFFIFYFSAIFYTSTKYSIIFIIINCFVYCTVYFLLKRKLKNNLI